MRKMIAATAVIASLALGSAAFAAPANTDAKPVAAQVSKVQTPSKTPVRTTASKTTAHKTAAKHKAVHHKATKAKLTKSSVKTPVAKPAAKKG